MKKTICSLTAVGVVGVAGAYLYLQKQKQEPAIPKVPVKKEVVESEEANGKNRPSNRIVHDSPSKLKPGVVEHAKTTEKKVKNLVHVIEKDADPFLDKKEIYKKFPYLETSDNNETKVIFSEEDWDKIYEDLSNVQNITDVIEGMKSQYKVITKDNYSFVNMMRVDFLKQGLRLRDNPSRDFLIEKIVSIISYFPSQEEKNSLSPKGISEMLGDKLDLLYALKMYDRARYTNLKEVAFGKLKKLIDYAEENEMYHRRFSE